MTALETFSSLWRELDGRADALSALALAGVDPVLPSSFRVGTAAQTSIAAVALAVREIDRLRTGREQSVSVDMRHAAVECRSERYLKVVGATPGELWDDIAFVLEDEDNDDINEQEEEIDEYLQNLEDDEVPPENLWDDLEV